MRASCIWRSRDGEPWLVSFEFAEVAGRLECVGTGLRSYLRREAQDALGSYPSYLEGEVSRDDLLPQPSRLPSDVNLLDPAERSACLQAAESWADESSEPLHAVLYDGDAVDALLHDPGQGWKPTTTPRPLRATILRELPLGDLLARVRRRVAADWRSGAIAPRTAVSGSGDHPLAQAAPSAAELEQRRRFAAIREELEHQTWEVLSAVKARDGWDDELIRRRDRLSQQFAELDDLELFAASQAKRPAAIEDVAEPAPQPVRLDAQRFMQLTQEAASSFSPPGQKAGRPSHFSLAQLELVATTYREAYRSGSSSPTKDVAAKLGMTRSRAAKLVMRCRDPRVRLLAPTDKRKAGETTSAPRSDEPNVTRDEK